MGIALALTELRADLPGYTGPVGFRSTAHSTVPCPCCNVRKSDMGSLNNVSIGGGEWDPFTDAQFLAEVAACRIVVRIENANDVRMIMRAPLEYDHRKANGYLGRRILTPVLLTSGFLLQTNDRLHPSRALRDVANFEFQDLPFDCTFWRFDPKSARLLHLSPLMQIPGVGMSTWCVDILHSWHLGGLARFIGSSLWFVLRSDVYGVGANMPWLMADDILYLNLLRLRSELWLHYQQKSRDPEWRKSASRVWNLTTKMLGKESNPNMKSKANETVHLLEFTVALLESHAAALEPVTQRFLLASGRAAVQVNDIIRTSDRVMSVATQQRLLDVYVRHCSMYVRAGGVLVPKHHIMLHCIQRCGELGNPRFYSCYRDESLNGVLVKISRSAHRMTFMQTVHKKFRVLGRLGLSTHMY